ncbi:TPA: conjugal transfer protein TraD [Burkholderia vietnamiensis]|nr:conjugal transfer protein TraD [Burkholderia vietnamiensis]HDR9172668.1 conjugal transfer protein TraD [Burkholderia vietnamiensis]
MKPTTLLDAEKRAAQLRNRAATVLARARVADRKAQTRRKIIAGGLVWKAGLADVDPDVLLGGLMVLAENLGGANGETVASRFAHKAQTAQTTPNPTAGPVEGSSLPTDQGGTGTDQVPAGA